MLIIIAIIFILLGLDFYEEMGPTPLICATVIASIILIFEYINDREEK